MRQRAAVAPDRLRDERRRQPCAGGNCRRWPMFRRARSRSAALHVDDAVRRRDRSIRRRARTGSIGGLRRIANEDAAHIEHRLGADGDVQRRSLGRCRTWCAWRAASISPPGAVTPPRTVTAPSERFERDRRLLGRIRLRDDPRACVDQHAGRRAGPVSP